MFRPLSCVLAIAVAAAAGGCAPGPAGPEDADVATAAVDPARGCEALDGYDATFLLHLPDEAAWRACNPARAERRYLPASTFKIANALIALETGAVAGPHDAMAWDGVERGIDAWNADADLARGMRDSVVWYYQALARRIGAERMRSTLGRLAYGNGEIGADSDLDQFWLVGDLRISAHEQVDFLDRLRLRALPLSARSQDIVAGILEVDAGPGWTLRAKTGAAMPIGPDGAMLQGTAGAERMRGAEPVGWFVGYVDRGGEGDAVFAFNMDLDGTGDLPLRTRLARELLEANGALPPAERAEPPAGAPGAVSPADRPGSTGR